MLPHLALAAQAVLPQEDMNLPLLQGIRKSDEGFRSSQTPEDDFPTRGRPNADFA